MTKGIIKRPSGTDGKAILGSEGLAAINNLEKVAMKDLDEDKTEEIIQTLLEDKLPKSGSAKNRKNTAPENGKTTLLEVKNA